MQAYFLDQVCPLPEQEDDVCLPEAAMDLVEIANLPPYFDIFGLPTPLGSCPCDFAGESERERAECRRTHHHHSEQTALPTVE
jgi:hypothetical protein